MSGWYANMVECRICGEEHAAVYPEGTDDDNMECPGCGHMTCEVVECINNTGDPQ